MAAITLLQTNTSTSYNAGTSGATDGTVTVGREMDPGGSPGETEFLPETVLGTDLDRGCVRWLSTNAIGQTTWQGGAGALGDYVVPINISTALTANFIEEVWIDELEDDGTTYVNVTKLQTIQVSIASTGVKTITVNRATNYTPKNSSSKLSITVVFQSDRLHGGIAFGVTADQTITTPIDDGVGDVFHENRVSAIEQQQKPLTSSGLGGVLIE